MAATWGTRTPVSMTGFLERNAADRPDRVALWVDGATVTHREMLERSVALANGYHGIGLGAGDVVAAFMANGFEHAYSWHACWHLGTGHVPINVNMSGDFLRHQLVTSGARAVVADPALVPRIVELGDAVPALEHLIVRGGAGDAAGLDTGRFKATTTADLLASDRDRVHGDRAVDQSALNAIIFTGGTTGPSKAAAMSRGYVMAMMETMARMWRFDGECSFYQPTPMFHINAAANCIMLPTLTGGRGNSQSAFSASGFWDAARECGATHTSIFGPLYLMLWAQPPRDDDADNPVRISTGYAPAELRDPFQRRFGIKILNIYALSEALPVTLDDYDDPGPAGTSGRPNPDFDVRIFDDDDEEVPAGEPGEIVLRPRRPWVMFSGYHNHPQATVETWRNLWFHTGDIGRFDADGYLVFVDRKADYLRRRGVNISCWDVEQAIVRHPAVADVAVIGVPSELGEQEVKACLVLRPGAEFDPVEFLDFCSAAMPHFAVPRFIDVVDALPRSPVGRVTKQPLRQRGNTAETLDREAMGYVVPK
ncbi:MAG TPA: AMP-binding protein [Acidimicrobiia bacterium]|nr:AMP-binding protein [Acidimicrobiia bacterium]